MTQGLTPELEPSGWVLRTRIDETTTVSVRLLAGGDALLSIHLWPDPRWIDVRGNVATFRRILGEALLQVDVAEALDRPGSRPSPQGRQW